MPGFCLELIRNDINMALLEVLDLPSVDDLICYTMALGTQNAKVTSVGKPDQFGFVSVHIELA